MLVKRPMASLKRFVEVWEPCQSHLQTRASSMCLQPLTIGVGMESNELYEVVDKISENEFPLTGEDLAERAENMGASEDSVSFFESLGDWQVESPDELKSVVEQASDPELSTEGDTTAGYEDIA
jgi:hypothetical protein